MTQAAIVAQGSSHGVCTGSLSPEHGDSKTMLQGGRREGQPQGQAGTSARGSALSHRTQDTGEPSQGWTWAVRRSGMESRSVRSVEARVAVALLLWTHSSPSGLSFLWREDCPGHPWAPSTPGANGAAARRTFSQRQVAALGASRSQPHPLAQGGPREPLGCRVSTAPGPGWDLRLGCRAGPRGWEDHAASGLVGDSWARERLALGSGPATCEWPRAPSLHPALPWGSASPSK